MLCFPQDREANFEGTLSGLGGPLTLRSWQECAVAASRPVFGPPPVIFQGEPAAPWSHDTYGHSSDGPLAPGLQWQVPAGSWADSCPLRPSVNTVRPPRSWRAWAAQRTQKACKEPQPGCYGAWRRIGLPTLGSSVGVGGGGEVWPCGSASPGLLQRSPARGQRRAGGAGGKLTLRGRGVRSSPCVVRGRGAPSSPRAARSARPPGRTWVPARRGAPSREGVWLPGRGSQSTRRPPCSPLGPVARPRLRNAGGSTARARSPEPAPRRRVACQSRQPRCADPGRLHDGSGPTECLDARGAPWRPARRPHRHRLRRANRRACPARRRRPLPGAPPRGRRSRAGRGPGVRSERRLRAWAPVGVLRGSRLFSQPPRDFTLLSGLGTPHTRRPLRGSAASLCAQSLVMSDSILRRFGPRSRAVGRTPGPRVEAGRRRRSSPPRRTPNQRSVAWVLV
nr:peptidyl-prolyl cis-trans isomerase CYP95-like [Chlorocebus sabaeus]